MDSCDDRRITEKYTNYIEQRAINSDFMCPASNDINFIDRVTMLPYCTYGDLQKRWSLQPITEQSTHHIKQV